MKRCIIILLVMTLIFSSMSFSYASENNYGGYAQKLSLLNVFKGTGNSFELNRTPTRLEGLVMFIRLLGVESNADMLKNDPCTFNDVPSWGIGYVNYAYKNGLTKGTGEGSFGSNDSIDANSYITFLLRALGYSDELNNPDFTWMNADDFGKSVGLIEPELFNHISTKEFTRANVAKLSHNALMLNLKNSQTTLLQKLVNDGVITEAMAEDFVVQPIPDVATLYPYGFTEDFDVYSAPEGTVDSYSPTDILYYVVIGANFPKGSTIYQKWEYLGDGSTIEGDLFFADDVKNNYLCFNLTPDGEFSIGEYRVTLTWNINGVDGELVSDIIEVR